MAPGCQVYPPSSYEVCGAIRDKYNELGGPLHQSSQLVVGRTHITGHPNMIGNRRGKLEATRRPESHPTLKSHWHQELNSYVMMPSQFLSGSTPTGRP